MQRNIGEWATTLCGLCGKKIVRCTRYKLAVKTIGSKDQSWRKMAAIIAAQKPLFENAT